MSFAAASSRFDRVSWLMMQSCYLCFIGPVRANVDGVDGGIVGDTEPASCPIPRSFTKLLPPVP